MSSSRRYQNVSVHMYIKTYIHVYMNYVKKKNQELWKDEVDFRQIFIKYIYNLFHREMGERFRREVLAHGGEIPPKDLING